MFEDINPFKEGIIESPWYNIFFVVLVTTISILIIKSTNLEALGMAATATVLYPVFIGGLTIMSYLLSRLIFKKYHFLVSLIGMFLSLWFSISRIWPFNQFF